MVVFCKFILVYILGGLKVGVEVGAQEVAVIRKSMLLLLIKALKAFLARLSLPVGRGLF